MSDKKVKVSIIIPHYNQKLCLQSLFPNLVDQTYKDFEVILIDDCTPDEAAITFVRDFIKDKPNMHLVQNKVNMRFVKTVNKGITLAKGEYICLLNSDTEVKNNFVQRNVEILDSDPDIGGVTCTIVDHKGKNWFSGGSYRKGFPSNLMDDFQGIRSVDFIAGTAVFYRKVIFDRIGLFDENFIMYHEDVEFGLRVKHYTDYRLCTFSDKLVTHILVASIPGRDMWYYASRNLMLMARKYSPINIPTVIGHIMFSNVCKFLFTATEEFIFGNFSSSIFWFSIAFACFRGTVEGIIVKQTAHSCR
jgi:GT2 family glycosyltransferase